jgi:Flp pilus assembly pilin Flp
MLNSLSRAVHASALIVLVGVLAMPATVAARIDRLRDKSDDRGASAVEWAIIAGAVCILAALVYAAVSAAVNNHDKNIK